MKMLQELFLIYAVAAAIFVFVILLHMLPVHSHAVFSGDRLPKHALVMNFAPVERHSVGVQSPYTLIKPVN